MLDAIHKHLISELERAARGDTVFIVCGVAFNIIVMYTNWLVGIHLSEPPRNQDSHSIGTILIFFLLIVGSLIVTCTVFVALLNGKAACRQISESLRKLYHDQGFGDYVPDSLHIHGNKRFLLSSIVVLGTGLLAVVIPILAYIA